MTPRLIKAARALLDWDQRALANAAGLSLPTIQRVEKLGIERSSVANADKLRGALETAGIEFLDDELAPGVRLRSNQPAPTSEP